MPAVQSRSVGCKESGPLWGEGPELVQVVGPGLVMGSDLVMGLEWAGSELKKGMEEEM